LRLKDGLEMARSAVGVKAPERFMGCAPATGVVGIGRRRRCPLGQGAEPPYNETENRGVTRPTGEATG
jgi:hypothetical protein